jgi:hypothetical protein
LIRKVTAASKVADSLLLFREWSDTCRECINSRMTAGRTFNSAPESSFKAFGMFFQRLPGHEVRKRQRTASHIICRKTRKLGQLKLGNYDVPETAALRSLIDGANEPWDKAAQTHTNMFSQSTTRKEGSTMKTSLPTVSFPYLISTSHTHSSAISELETTTAPQFQNQNNDRLLPECPPYFAPVSFPRRPWRSVAGSASHPVPGSASGMELGSRACKASRELVRF